MVDEQVKSRIREDYVFVRLEYESTEARDFMERAGRRGFPIMFTVDAATYGQATTGEGAGSAGVTSFPIRWDPSAFAEALDSARS